MNHYIAAAVLVNRPVRKALVPSISWTYSAKPHKCICSWKHENGYVILSQSG